VVGSLLSSNGGVGKGNLKITRAAPFNGLGSYDGDQVDLDGDGDKDVGTNNITAGVDFYSARSASMTTAGTVSGNSKSFKLATATFTVTSLNSSGQTNITFRPRTATGTQDGTGGIWEEDGLPKNDELSSFTAGTFIALTRDGSGGGGGGGGGGGNTAKLSGIVFSDSDKDGVLDSTDTRLSGKKMFIDVDKDGKLDTGEPTTTTNSSGEYSFSNLAAGNYRVRRGDLPAGYTYSTPSTGYHEVTLGDGQQVSGLNFGAIPIGGGGGGGGNTAKLSGIVFSDSDKDGVLDSTDTRLSGKKMFIDVDKDGKLDTGEPTTTSNASGEYSFSNLAAGTYRVRRADLPGGYTFSTPSSGYHEVTLSAGQQVSGKNFGAIPIGGGGNTARISGIVFSDNDKDGVLDTTDTRLASRKMYIDLDKDGKLDTGEPTFITNASGEYSFSNLAAGTYRIRRADLPSGYGFSVPSTGYHEVTLSAGQQVSGKNFGAIKL
jgi:uncharacterized surface anchored protein